MKRIVVICALFSLGVVVGCNDSNSPVEPGRDLQQIAPFSKHSAQDGADSDAEYDGYIVMLDNSVSANDVESVAAELGRKHKGKIGKSFKHAIKGFSVDLSDAEVANLKKDRRVKLVEPDYIISVDPFGARTTGKKGGGNTTTPTTSPTGGTGGSQVTPWGVAAVGGSHDGTGKTAWIIDTGIDFENSDLNVDIGRSRNFVTDGQTADDVYGHGTHVAGTIGARNNTVGVVGIAANATLVSVRVLGNDGRGTYSAIIAGIDYVAANGREGDVANLSLGGSPSEALDAAVINAANRGIRFAIAAGNSTTSAATISPARVEHSNVYTVSAIGSDGTFASFSNYGNPPIDFAAPGVSIVSSGNGGGTATKSGTSMASPHVAGLLLLNSIRASGYAKNDPDGTADPIAHY
jgi:hypothetical protein